MAKVKRYSESVALSQEMVSLQRGISTGNAKHAVYGDLWGVIYDGSDSLRLKCLCIWSQGPHSGVFTSLRGSDPRRVILLEGVG